MNSDGGFSGEMKGCDFEFRWGVVWALRTRCVLFFFGVSSSTVVAWLYCMRADEDTSPPLFGIWGVAL